MVKPYRRRTDRVDTLIAQFVLRVGGNAGTALVRSIGIPVSASTGLPYATFHDKQATLNDARVYKELAML